MCESAHSLQDICVNFICDKIETFAQVYGEASSSNKNSNVFLHARLSELLLSALRDSGKLNDRSLQIFGNKLITRLETAVLIDLKNVSNQGLRHILSHNISRFEVVGRQSAVHELITGFSEWTFKNLRVLGISGCTFLGKTPSVVLLTKLKNLRALDVSNTDFNNHALKILAEDLPFLKAVDVSETHISDIGALWRCRDRLISLSLHNLQLSDSTAKILNEMRNLRHLDISVDPSVSGNNQIFRRLGETSSPFSPQDFLQNPECLPQIESLDISGCENISHQTLADFIRRHKNLEFLGLFDSNLCFEEMFTLPNHRDHNPQLSVTGTANESQVFESLRRYQRKHQRVQKSLYELFSLTQFFGEPRVEAIQLVIQSMRRHPDQFAIQMAATACLYNLTKGELGQKIHPQVLKQVVHYTLTAMEIYPNNLQLQKNTLLTLCSDRILQDVSFDRYRCARLVLNCLCTFDDASMGRMSVAICSILAAKISTVETSKLGSEPRYMRKLLAIVKNKMEAGQVDITLKFTLSALWNLTDESPRTCSVFLQENGLDLFLQVLEAFAGEQTVETKVLGLLNNIAEVAKLRSHLMVDSFLVVLRKLLHSELIDVSYFAAGIIAHLASSGPDAWTSKVVSRQEVLSELGTVVLSWDSPDGEMVAYRSFCPFFHLLLCYDAPEVQLWALWAIQHVCSKNAKRYCAMLSNEQGDDLLRTISCRPEAPAHVKEFCRTILQILEREFVCLIE